MLEKEREKDGRAEMKWSPSLNFPKLRWRRWRKGEKEEEEGRNV